MGWGKKIKDTFKDAGNALTDPLNLVNMTSSIYSLGKNIEKRHVRSNLEEKAQEAAVRQAAVNAAEQDFQNDLDRKRRSSKRTNVIFAGLLGNSDEIGLGGQKNLLGL